MAYRLLAATTHESTSQTSVHLCLQEVLGGAYTGEEWRSRACV